MNDLPLDEEAELRNEFRLSDDREAAYEARRVRVAEINTKYLWLNAPWLVLGAVSGVIFFLNLNSSLSKGMQYAIFYPLACAMSGLILNICWRDYALHPEKGVWTSVKKNLVLFFLAAGELVTPLAIIGNHRWALLAMIACISLALIEMALSRLSVDTRKRYTLLGVIHD